MNDIDVKLIAKKLNWKKDEVQQAIDELLEADSVVINWREFFLLCTDSRDHYFRWIKIREPIEKYLQNVDILEVIIRNIKSPDPCFIVWALFNIADTEDYKNFLLWKEQKAKKSFIIDHSVEIGGWIFNQKELYNPYALADSTLSTKIGSEDKYDARKLLLKTVEKIGYLAFNLSAFNSRAISYSLHPEFSKYEKELTGALNEKILNNNRNKQREYWLFYILIEKLKKKLGFKPLCRKIGKKFHLEGISIERRYFEQKKKAKNLKLSEDDIITEYYLGPSIEKHVSEFVSNSNVKSV